MANYKSIIAYDGTDFQGFQRLGGDRRTVQGVFEDALRRLGWEGGSPEPSRQSFRIGSLHLRSASCQPRLDALQWLLLDGSHQTPGIRVPALQGALPGEWTVATPLPVRQQPLARQVLGILIERILRGIYAPGTRLPPPENLLSQEFNVSRAI